MSKRKKYTEELKKRKKKLFEKISKTSPKELKKRKRYLIEKYKNISPFLLKKTEYDPNDLDNMINTIDKFTLIDLQKYRKRYRYFY